MIELINTVRFPNYNIIDSNINKASYFFSKKDNLVLVENAFEMIKSYPEVDCYLEKNMPHAFSIRHSKL